MNKTETTLKLVAKILGFIVCLHYWINVGEHFSVLRLLMAAGFTFFIAVFGFGLGARRRP